MSKSAVLLLPFLSLIANGQNVTSRWADVTAIGAGTEIRVATSAPKPIQGKVESITDSMLVIRMKTGMQSFQQTEIRGVSVKKKGHRVRNTFIGLGVGAGAGLGIGAAATHNCTELVCGLAVAASTGIGIIAGTVGGLVWPTGGWRPVYAQ